MVIISNCYAIHHVSNFASSCRVADLQVRNVPWSECTHYLVHTSLVFGHYYLECDCVNGSTGIITSIDTISNINLKDGMCHMKVDWFITYTI